MARKKRKRTAEDVAFDERTELIEARIAELGKQNAKRKAALQAKS
jgi:hypothetical protein